MVDQSDLDRLLAIKSADTMSLNERVDVIVAGLDQQQRIELADAFATVSILPLKLTMRIKLRILGS